MATHRDAHSPQQTAWSNDFARDYERAFGHHPATLQSARPEHDREQRPGAAAGGSIIDQMTSQMQARLADVERRHADALRDVQIKLERMSGDAVRARPVVPAELTTAFTRIEQGMAHLADRIADAGPERRRGADAFVFAAPQSEATHFVFNAKPHKPVAPVSIEPPGGFDPWDDEQAEELARLYERGDAGFGQSLPQPAFVPQHLPATAVFAHAGQHGPMVAGLGNDRTWLDERLSGLTDHVAKSIAAAQPSAALTGLMDRVDQLESRFGSALGELATKSDLDAMRKSAKPDVSLAVLSGLEAQIKDLAGHIETTHQQLSRLDVIEQHLSDLQAFAHASMDAEPSAAEHAAAVPATEDFAKLAEIAVEHALARMPAPAAQAAFDPLAGAERAATQTRIDAVHGLLNDFAAERRRGDQYTTGMLETVQEALIRLIDRVDSIETGKGHAAGVGSADVSARAPHIEPEQEQPTANPQPGRRREPRQVEAVTAATATVAPAAKLNVTDPNLVNQSLAAAAVEAAERQEISISDLKLKTRRVPISPAVEPVVEQAAEIAAEPAAKPARKSRAAAAPSGSSASKRGIVVAALALGLVGIAYVASLMLADRYGPVSSPSTPSVAPPKAALAAPAKTSPSATTNSTAPAVAPPGMIGEPVRAAPIIVPRPAGAPKDGPVLRLPAENSQRSQAPAAATAADNSVEEALKPRKPSTIPETVNDDISQLDNDSPMRDALPTAADKQVVPAPRVVGSINAMPGMALEQPGNSVPFADARGLQRHTSMASASERLGMQARPASDFSSRFGAAGSTATITTGSNPDTRPQPVSTSPQAATPQAPIETAVTDNVSETAELPPALVGPLSLRIAASKGDPSAAFEVATRLAEGRGIKQDFKQAITWYQRSANKGFAVAQYRLGTLYERGLGTAVDTNRARVWYKRAADQGNVKAMHNMAVLSAGNGQSAPDYPTAAKWFKDAADRGLADSQFNLGVLNESGLGIPKDSRAAYVWFSLAARSGDAEAARRRDLLLASLDADTLKSADEQARAWRARAVDVKINDPRVAGDQWRMQAQGQSEPTSLAQPVIPEPARAPVAAASGQQAAPVIAPRVIKAPAPIR